MLLPQFSKGATHFFDKNVRLLKSGEMATALSLVPVDEIGIGLISPALWSAIYLANYNCQTSPEKKYCRLVLPASIGYLKLSAASSSCAPDRAPSLALYSSIRFPFALSPSGMKISPASQISIW